jgi:hypothetical protein
VKRPVQEDDRIALKIVEQRLAGAKILHGMLRVRSYAEFSGVIFCAFQAGLALPPVADGAIREQSGSCQLAFLLSCSLAAR